MPGRNRRHATAAGPLHAIGRRHPHATAASPLHATHGARHLEQPHDPPVGSPPRVAGLAARPPVAALPDTGGCRPLLPIRRPARRQVAGTLPAVAIGTRAPDVDRHGGRTTRSVAPPESAHSTHLGNSASAPGALAHPPADPGRRACQSRQPPPGGAPSRACTAALAHPPADPGRRACQSRQPPHGGAPVPRLHARARARNAARTTLRAAAAPTWRDPATDLVSRARHP